MSLPAVDQSTENNHVDEDQALAELEAFLAPRLADAEAGNVVSESLESIFSRVSERKLGKSEDTL